MARTGLTKSEVRASRDRLLAEGRYPSVDAVRAALGTGSKSTIHKYLKELGSEDGDAGVKREDTTRTLYGIVEQLADQLHGDAERRLETLRASYEEELAELRATVARLSARVEELEGAPPTQPAASGFGDFSDLQSSSRSGRSEHSPFNTVLSGGRSAVFDLDHLQTAGQIQLTPRAYPG
jgi:hypothetical protein